MASSVMMGTWRTRSATSAGSDGIRLINTKHTNEITIRSGIADRTPLNDVLFHELKISFPLNIKKNSRHMHNKPPGWTACQIGLYLSLRLR